MTRSIKIKLWLVLWSFFAEVMFYPYSSWFLSLPLLWGPEGRRDRMVNKLLTKLGYSKIFVLWVVGQVVVRVSKSQLSEHSFDLKSQNHSFLLVLTLHQGWFLTSNLYLPCSKDLQNKKVSKWLSQTQLDSREAVPVCSIFTTLQLPSNELFSSFQ